ncbi:MAG TPA: ATP-dependent DNA helicase RecG [Flavobacteriaceae bacterium]|nr:ATP-dependent DNA helicase RecG [Flavobacteriaceae bacterium]
MNNKNILDTSIEFIKGVGPSRAKLFKEELNITNYDDLINFFPFRYIDRRKFYKIKDLPDLPTDVQIVGKVVKKTSLNNKFNKRLSLIFEDDTGQIELLWFRGYSWIEDSIDKNKEYVVFGKLNWYKKKITITHPEIKLKSTFDRNVPRRLHGIYSSTEKLTASGITQRYFIKIIYELIQSTNGKIQENLPSYIRKKYSLIDRQNAFTNIHLPESNDKLKKAIDRLKFEELFFNQLGFLLSKTERLEKINGFQFKIVGDNFNKFYNESLPFELTGDQKKVIKEIRKDFKSGKQMNRLLQGDVGSGKTIVSLMLILIAIDNGYQSCILSPTEILAYQHFDSISTLLKDFNINVEILTGSTPIKSRKKIHQRLLNNEIHILIGTHAILEDIVKFKNLGLAIIDEQHRFGVAQRAKLWKKNTSPPHILVMTATPIPRTLAMSVYGDLDISIIKELPPGRKKTITVHRYDKNRLSVYKFLKDQIKLGRQVYIVYPLINESEKLDYKDLVDGYESMLRDFPRPEYQVGILHGKMKSSDKNIEMERFVNNKTQILVSTTVIEVGVNVPNASVMMIESSERFGLSQLHQLRGRVGRGNDESYCILMTKDNLSNDAKTRTDTMVQIDDGFKLSEVDLKLRGPGDVLGTKQSGILKFKIADIINDHDILAKARDCVSEILSIDPKLKLPTNLSIRDYISQSGKSKNLWRYIS